MTERFESRELDDLFERYRAHPKGHVFAPLADACRKAGMLEEALEICARGVGENPRYASGYVVQGKCLYDAGRRDDARAAFDRVLELDPKNLVALKFLGIIHAERGEAAHAREYFEHILALDPGDREIRSRIEDVAHPHVTRSTKVAPDAPKPPAEQRSETKDVDSSADEAVHLPDVEDEHFEGESITLRDESVTSDEIATMTLADIYASQGYSARALKIYRQVLTRQPGNRALAAKIERLEIEEAAAASRAAPPPARRIDPPRAPRTAPVRSRGASDAPAGADAPTPGPAPAGRPIDQSRSYEQFKRWLKASSR